MIFCSNCGQENPDGGNFCSRCGNRLSVPAPSVPISPAQTAQAKQSPWKLLLKAVGLFFLVFLTTFCTLTIWGVLDTLSPLSGNQTAEAEALAVEFVSEYYPEMVNAERNAYVATIDGTGYYVVDFVLREPGKSPEGVRILVDRLLRAVFAYEVIES